MAYASLMGLCEAQQTIQTSAVGTPQKVDRLLVHVRLMLMPCTCEASVDRLWYCTTLSYAAMEYGASAKHLYTHAWFNTQVRNIKDTSHEPGKM